ncbi:MAG: HAD family hydrolase [Thermodesulfobacteriota bacterium]|nr:HAD family hydrolase [Thermodesulfobacteriota bacterium]
MKNIKVIIFDCDGVMFDTVKANTAYYNSVLNHFGRPDMTPEQFAYSHMHTADNAMAYLFDDKKMLEAAQAYRKNMSYLPFLKYMEIEPYLKPLLKRLRLKYKTAVATNRADTMKRVLVEHKLEDYFDLVVSALDVMCPKPHPDQLTKILKHFNIAPYNAIYIGDSKLDEIAAKAAEIPLIAYKNRSLSADFHIDSLKEIEDILEISRF